MYERKRTPFYRCPYGLSLVFQPSVRPAWRVSLWECRILTERIPDSHGEKSWFSLRESNIRIRISHFGCRPVDERMQNSLSMEARLAAAVPHQRSWHTAPTLQEMHRLLGETAGIILYTATTATRLPPPISQSFRMLGCWWQWKTEISGWFAIPECRYHLPALRRRWSQLMPASHLQAGTHGTGQGDWNPMKRRDPLNQHSNPTNRNTSHFDDCRPKWNYLVKVVWYAISSQLIF